MLGCIFLFELCEVSCVIILFVFMLVFVLELVWNIFIGKCINILFIVNSLLYVLMMVCLWLMVSVLSFMFVCVVVFLIVMSVWMNVFGICWLFMGKLFIVCCVCVLYSVFLGIWSFFMLLCFVCVVVIICVFVLMKMVENLGIVFSKFFLFWICLYLLLFV